MTSNLAEMQLEIKEERKKDLTEEIDAIIARAFGIQGQQQGSSQGS